MKIVAWLGVGLVAAVMVAGLIFSPGLIHTSGPTAKTVAPGCAFGTDAQCATHDSSSASAQIENPALGPLYNSLVQPYASVIGPYSYVAGGAAMRDQGYGTISLTWTGGLVEAFMVWSIMDDSVPTLTATLNGHTVTGTWVAYATPSPCWAPTYIYTMVAAVTPYVTNGANSLTNFPSGITTGSDPWASAQTDPM